MPSAAVLSPALYVRSGKSRDLEDGAMIWGLIPLSIKLSAKDTRGELFVIQHCGVFRGGPPRHVHFAQDEWFYVTEGEFLIEVGQERFRATPGDSLFAPRMIPHVWAHVGSGRGSIITTITPAGTFEEFLRDTTRCSTIPSSDELPRIFEKHAMQIIGPPLSCPS